MGNFQGREISRFCGYSRKFSLWNFGTWCRLVAPASNPQSFLPASLFLTNSQKFSPSKVPRYTVCDMHVKIYCVNICLMMYIRLFWLQLGTGLGVIGALYLCISVPNVCSSIIVGKLTDILVRILLASFPGLKRLGTCLPGLGQNVSCIICDLHKLKV